MLTPDTDSDASDLESVESEEEGSDVDEMDVTYERYTDMLDAELDAAYEQFSDRRAAQKQSTKVETEDLYAQVKSTKEAVAAPTDEPCELIGSVPEGNVSRAANMWFQQPMFDGIGDAEDDDSDLEDNDSTTKRSKIASRPIHSESDDMEDEPSSDEEAPVGKRARNTPAAARRTDKATGGGGGSAVHTESEYEPEPKSFGTGQSANDGGDSDSGEESVDDDGYDSDEKATVMALAPQMVRKKSREEFIDAGYNRYAHNDDQSILPKWFVEDELKHHRPIMPVTKEEAVRARAEARAINLRPIKKVAEAKARKKRKDSRRTEKVKAKAEAIAEADDVSAKAKMRAIEKLMKAEKQKKPDAVYVTTSRSGQSKVVSKKAGGGGRQGRTVKVDKRLKSDKRGKQNAEKRKSKKGHKGNARKRR